MTGNGRDNIGTLNKMGLCVYIGTDGKFECKMPVTHHRTLVLQGYLGMSLATAGDLEIFSLSCKFWTLH